MDSHEKYLESCAALIAGELSVEEGQKLHEHLAVCASCRRAIREYESAVQTVIPSLADDLSSSSDESDPASSIEHAETALFQRLETDLHTLPSRQGVIEAPESELPGRRFTYRPSRNSLERTVDAGCGVRSLGHLFRKRRGVHCAECFSGVWRQCVYSGRSSAECCSVATNTWSPPLRPTRC
jgi:Putative zinc-finger